MKLLFLEPFYSGSHKAFADGLIRHSSHGIDLVSMPGDYWNWRTRGSAFFFSKAIKDISSYDGIITTSLMRLADFKAFIPERIPPVLVYFHENQLTYPLAPKEKRNPHMSMGDISTALSAERVIFNSEFQIKGFLNEAQKLIDSSPDSRPCWVVDEIRSKSSVLYPGCSLSFSGSEDEKTEEKPPLIIWNHRWAYDKNPEAFFHALEIIKSKNIEFRLVLLGERSDFIPESFIKAKNKFKDEILFSGYLNDRHKYHDWLIKGDIIVSTAIQENFGYSVVEGIYSGSIPLLPGRLSYPEILPPEFHSDFLYKSQKDFIEKLIKILLNPELFKERAKGLSNMITRYSWEKMIKLYDLEISRLCKGGDS